MLTKRKQWAPNFETWSLTNLKNTIEVYFYIFDTVKCKNDKNSKFRAHIFIAVDVDFPSSNLEAKLSKIKEVIPLLNFAIACSF